MAHDMTVGQMRKEAAAAGCGFYHKQRKGANATEYEVRHGPVRITWNHRRGGYFAVYLLGKLVPYKLEARHRLADGARRAYFEEALTIVRDPGRLARLIIAQLDGQVRLCRNELGAAEIELRITQQQFNKYLVGPPTSDPD